MDSIVFGVIFALIIVISQAQRSKDDPNIQLMMKMAKTCQEQEKSTEADFKQMMQHELPTSRTGKCMHACMMESIGLIADGKPSPENAIEIARMMSNDDPEVVRLTKEIANECASAIDDDRCEMAHKMLVCSINATKKRGFDMKKLLPH